jgi:DNA-binding phage protein
MAEKIETPLWRSEDYVETAQDIAAYLEAVFDDADPDDADPVLIAYALDLAARIEGT